MNQMSFFLALPSSILHVIFPRPIETPQNIHAALQYNRLVKRPRRGRLAEGCYLKLRMVDEMK